MKLILEYRYNEFAEYLSARDGLDAHKASMWMQKLFIVPLIASFLLFLPVHIIVSPGKLSAKFYSWILPRNYASGQIAKVAYYSYYIGDDGKEYYEPSYTIFFKNNSNLSLGEYCDTITGQQKIVAALKVKVDTIRAEKN